MGAESCRISLSAESRRISLMTSHTRLDRKFSCLFSTKKKRFRCVTLFYTINFIYRPYLSAATSCTLSFHQNILAAALHFLLDFIRNFFFFWDGTDPLGLG